LILYHFELGRTIWTKLKLPAAPEIVVVEEPDGELLIAVPLERANAVPAASTKPVARMIDLRCIKSLSESVEAKLGSIGVIR
jgi:hypothetical protein